MKRHTLPSRPTPDDAPFGYVPPKGVQGELCWPEACALPELGTGQSAPLLLSDLSLTWSQPIRRVFEVGPARPGGCSPTVYQVGPADFALGAGVVVGPLAATQAFYRRYTAGPPGGDPSPPL